MKINEAKRQAHNLFQVASNIFMWRSLSSNCSNSLGLHRVDLNLKQPKEFNPSAVLQFAPKFGTARPKKGWRRSPCKYVQW